MSAPPKPAYGSPCNGCGRCCEAVLCPLGAHQFGATHGPCPALRYIDGRSACGLVAAPRDFEPVRVAMHGAGRLAAAARAMIGSGYGCDAVADGETRDEAQRQRMRRAAGRLRPAVAAGRRLWGIR